MCAGDRVALDGRVLARLGVDGHGIVRPAVDAAGDAVVGHLGLMGHRGWQAHSSRTVIDHRLMINLHIWPSLSDIIHEPSRVFGILERVLGSVFRVYLIIGRILVLSFNFLQSLSHDILDSVFLLRVGQRYWHLHLIPKILRLIEHAPDSSIGLLHS